VSELQRSLIMETYPSFLGHRLWIIALVTVGLNVAIMSARAAIDIKKHPERKHGYPRLIAGTAAGIALLFAYPLVAIHLRAVASLSQLVDWSQARLVVPGFYIYTFVLVCLFLSWVWLWGGLRAFASYPAIFHLPKSDLDLRLFWRFMTAFVLLAFTIVLSVLLFRLSK
jgi:hypothetical protein